MSLKSWKAEFYPRTPYQLMHKDDVDMYTMCEASILKWRGALPENLAKHNMEYGIDVSIQSKKTKALFYYGVSECVFCKIFMNCGDCQNCLFQRLFGGECFSISWEGIDDSPYNHFVDSKDPIPMIEALKVIKDYVEMRPQEFPRKKEE